MIIAEIYKDHDHRIVLTNDTPTGVEYIGSFFGHVHSIEKAMGRLLIKMGDIDVPNIYISADAIRKGER